MTTNCGCLELSLNGTPHFVVRFSAQKNKVPKINQLHLEILPFSIRKNNLRAAIGRLRIYDGLNGQRCTLCGRLATQKILGCQSSGRQTSYLHQKSERNTLYMHQKTLYNRIYIQYINKSIIKL